MCPVIIKIHRTFYFDYWWITKELYVIDQQYADDISWITTNKSAKEYIKNTVPNALIDKNLLVNPEKNRRILNK